MNWREKIEEQVSSLRDCYENSWLGPTRQVISEDDLEWIEIKQAIDALQALLDVAVAAEQVVRSSAPMPSPDPRVCWMDIDDGEVLEAALDKLREALRDD